MKTNFFLSKAIMTAGILLLAIAAYGQGNVPEGMNYQGVIRDAGGNIQANMPMTIRFTIQNGTMPPYVTEYVETQYVTSNAFGVVTAKIGKGTPVAGSFSNIQWENGTQLLQTEIDYNGGGYTSLGVTELLSVPYALSAKICRDAWSMNGNSGSTSATHFMGNKDSTDLVFRTNNQNRMVIHDNGKISFGFSNPVYRYQFRNTQPTEQIALLVEGSNDYYSSLYINALDAGARTTIGFTNQSFLRGMISTDPGGTEMAFKVGNTVSTGMLLSDLGCLNLPYAKGKITRSPVSDTNNVVATAYGNISSAGLINTKGSTNNFSVTKSSTGVYYITWNTASGINTFYTESAVSATAVGTTPRFITWTSTGGGTILMISIFDSTGTPVDCNFSFTVFKP